MRILGNSKIEMVSTINLISNKDIVESNSIKIESQNSVEQQNMFVNNEETDRKIQQAINTLNDFLEKTNNSSKFMYHEGLERYYITIVDKETEEVVKEIPPKKLLDAFYEMQKMLGMIVDEKI